MKGPGATQRWLLAYLENVRYDEREQPLYTRAFCDDLMPPGTSVKAFLRALPPAPPLGSEEEAAIAEASVAFVAETTESRDSESRRDSEYTAALEDIGPINFWVPLGRAIRARHG